LRFAQTLGIRNKEEHQVRWNNNAKPALGGISFYVVFLFSFIFTLLLPHTNFGFNMQIIGILIAATLAFLMGLADDAFNTQPLLKFLTQVFCAFIIIFSGHSVVIFQNQFINYLVKLYLTVIKLLSSSSYIISYSEKGYDDSFSILINLIIILVFLIVLLYH
jgi:UDP-GlcNAc:undecaprenyl-phosphate GlcNAc-1-phosphate transferase